jgi:hypothetical protein
VEPKDIYISEMDGVSEAFTRDGKAGMSAAEFGFSGREEM